MIRARSILAVLLATAFVGCFARIDRSRIPSHCDASLDVDPLNCGACGHSCLGGECKQGKCQPVAIASAATPVCLVQNGSLLYYVEATGAARSVHKDGTDVQELFNVPGTPVTCWADSRKLYVSTGAAVQTAQNEWPLGSSQTRYCGALATIPVPYTLIWLDYQQQTVESCSLGNCVGTIMQLAPARPNSSLGRLAVSGDDVYWTDSGGGAVLSTTRTGAPAVELAVNQAEPYGIAVDAHYVYWSNKGGGIYKVPRTGGKPELVAKATAPTELAVDKSHVYWLESGTTDGKVVEAPLSGGSATVLAEGQRSPVGLVVDDTSVYWATSVPQGQVLRVAK